MERDIFVATVACVLGLVLVFVSATGNPTYFSMRTPSKLVAWIGFLKARMLVGICGFGLLGIAGWLVFRTFQDHATPRTERRAATSQLGSDLEAQTSLVILGSLG